jgi:hypothetical protein
LLQRAFECFPAREMTVESRPADPCCGGELGHARPSVAGGERCGSLENPFPARGSIGPELALGKLLIGPGPLGVGHSTAP